MGNRRKREQGERRGGYSDCIGPKSNSRSPGPVQDEATDAPSDRPDWHRYHALREQWVHEDDLVHYRVVWLILSQGPSSSVRCGSLPSSLRWARESPSRRQAGLAFPQTSAVVEAPAAPPGKETIESAMTPPAATCRRPGRH